MAAIYGIISGTERNDALNKIKASLAHRGGNAPAIFAGAETLVAVDGQPSPEEVLSLYKEHDVDCVKHLRGGFAIAIWDAQKRRLLIARDHLGIKPVYFAQANGDFIFASEPKGILASDLIARKPDIAAIWHFISLRFVPDDLTLFDGVKKLGAAMWLTYEPDSGKIRSSEYWRLTAFSRKHEGDEKELTDRLEQVILDAVKAQMGDLDGVGSFLSGGIDSSLITAMMATLSGEKKFPTFSIGLKEQYLNELPWARMISQKYDLIAREEIVEADIVHKIPEMVYHMDEPADPFGVGVYLVSGVAKRDSRIVLTGDGGDENFAGYDRFVGQRLAGYYAMLPAFLRKHFCGPLFGLVKDNFGYKSIASKLKWLNDMSFYDAGERYAQSLCFLRFTDDIKEKLFARPLTGDGSSSIEKIIKYYNSPDADEALDKMLYTDLMTRMPDELMQVSDRMTAAHGLEARAPLMDAAVVEFAASLPPNLKVHGKTLKYLLRQVARRYMPSELIDRPKQGFGFPLARWLRGDLANFQRNLFKESRFVELGIFNREEIARLMDDHISGRADHNFRLWLLINLEFWHRVCIEGEKPEVMREKIDSLM